MLANNNQTAVDRIYRRMLSQNKVRNRVVILAIILTTFMFTAVFTLGFSMAKNMNQLQLRLQGTKASIYLANPTIEQLDIIKNCKYLHAAGVQIDAEVMTSQDEKYNIPLRYYDNAEFKKNFEPAITDINGSYPKAANEVMLSKKALLGIGIDKPVLNQTVTMYLEGQPVEFILSGWFTSFNKSNLCLVSKDYIEKQGYTMETNGRVSMSSKEGRQENLREELEDKVQFHDEQTFDVNYDVQQENNGNRIVIAISIFLIALMIVLSGYLLIYNVMYISVTKDIRFYGMLKTIGTSPSQIRIIVKRQARHLAMIGIPIGVCLGTAVSFGVVPLAMRMMEIDREDALSSAVSFNPFIYLFAVLFAFATVSISARKPAKLAGKVSAIDAMKYIGNSNSKRYKTTSGGKLSRMAWRNVFREKKRSILVFASMFMGTITFLCANTFVDCLDADSFIAHYLHDDYVLYGGESEQEYANQKVVTMVDIAEEMRAIDGMGEVYTNRSAHVILPFDAKLYEPFLELNEDPEEMAAFYSNPKSEDARYAAPLIAVNTGMIREYNKSARQKIDIDAFERGEVCLIGYLNTVEQSEQMFGKELVLLNDETGKEKTITIGAALLSNEDEAITAGYYWSLMGAPEAIIVSDTFMDQLFPDADVDCIIANAKPGCEKDVTPFVERIVKENSSIDGSDIRSVESAAIKKSMLSLGILGGGISLILILIGIVNYVNVMITGVYTRKTELAVMESVGMTKKQIRKMLMYEGMFYGIITIGLIATLGSAMMYGTGRLCLKIADYAIFHYPAGLLVGVAGVVFVICIVVPALVFKSIAKDTVTERLRAVA